MSSILCNLHLCKIDVWVSMSAKFRECWRRICSEKTHHPSPPSTLLHLPPARYSICPAVAIHLWERTPQRQHIAPDLILTLHHLPEVVSQAKRKPGGINISRSLFWHWPNLGWYWETATASFRTTYRVRKIVKCHSIKYCDVTEKSEIEIASTINPRWFVLWFVLMPLC